ncbi:protein kinase domain-containing protein [Ditylenchus destructor]|uniref:Serine/threonine-protein kinase greatwall n=1 Tax=Ditylenchus destructor TaxID=166010 RepID=A0AAD4QTW7_9BILA|nr:protein kinase domain-containing protein [Ditylenchus destructor]
MTPFRMILLVISLAIFINTAVCGKGGGNCLKTSKHQQGYEGHGGHQEHEEHEAGPSHTGYETGSSDDGNSHIKQWSEIISTWEEPIGYGAFGEVRKAKSKSDNEVYAIKIINKGETMTTAEIKNEIAIQLKLDNIFIVRLYDAYQSHEAFYLQLEMVEGGALLDLMKTVDKFEENAARFYAAEIICGLEYIHAKDIVYRDLKPENVLLTSKGHIKVSDIKVSDRVALFSDCTATSALK